MNTKFWMRLAREIDFLTRYQQPSFRFAKTLYARIEPWGA